MVSGPPGQAGEVISRHPSADSPALLSSSSSFY